MDTVEAILPQLSPFVGDSGVCEDSPKILAAINDVRLMLWNKADFLNTTEYVCYCVEDCCVTLPSRYKQIRQAYVCNRPLDLRGEWFQATAGLADCCGRVCGNYRNITEVGGYHATFREPDGEFYLAIAGESAGDTGTVLSFETLDASNKRWKFDLTVGSPFAKVFNGTTITNVLRAVKPKTESRVRVFAIDVVTGDECLIALYEGEDINPSFKRFKMPTQCGDKLVALCKLKYFPLTQDNELVEFDINALIPGLLALNARKARNSSDFLSQLNIAVLEANRSMSDAEVKGATPFKVYGSHAPQSLIPAV